MTGTVSHYRPVSLATESCSCHCFRVDPNLADQTQRGANEYFLVYREFWEMDWSDKDQWDWMGLKRETWCHFGKAWCHFVWFDWIACLPFCFFVFFLFGCFIGVCVRMFAVVFAFILEDCVLPVSACHPTQPAKMYFFEYSIFVLTPSSLPFLSPPSSYSAEGSICQSRHSCFEAGETNLPQTAEILSTPASSLKSPPTSYPPCRRLRRQIPHRSRVLGVAQDPVSG